MRLFRTILGMLLLTIGLPALLVGAGLWTTMQHRDAGGAFSGALQNLTAPGYAVVVDDVDTLLSVDAPFVRVGDSRLRLTGTTADGPAFIGIARRIDATRYLDGVSYAKVSAVDLGTGALPVATTRVIGAHAPSSAPSGQSFWLASGAGALDWNPSDLRGRAYSLIIMDADAQPGIRLTATAELRPGWLNGATWVLVILGSLLIVGGMMTLAWPGRRRELIYVVEPSQLPAFAEHLATPPESDRLSALLRIGRRHLRAFGWPAGAPAVTGRAASRPAGSPASRPAGSVTPGSGGPAASRSGGPAASRLGVSTAPRSGVSADPRSGAPAAGAPTPGVPGRGTGSGPGSMLGSGVAPLSATRSATTMPPAAPDLTWPPTRPAGSGAGPGRRIKPDGTAVAALRAVPPSQYAAPTTTGRPASSGPTPAAGTSPAFASGAASLSVVPSSLPARRSPAPQSPSTPSPSTPSPSGLPTSGPASAGPASAGPASAGPASAGSSSGLPMSGPSAPLPAGFSLAGFSPAGSQPSPASGAAATPPAPPRSATVGGTFTATVPGGHRAPGTPRARLEPVLGGPSAPERTNRRRAVDRPAGEEKAFEASAVEAWVAETVATRARNSQARAAAVLAAEEAVRRASAAGAPAAGVAPAVGVVPVVGAAPAGVAPAVGVTPVAGVASVAGGAGSAAEATAAPDVVPTPAKAAATAIGTTSDVAGEATPSSSDVVSGAASATVDAKARAGTRTRSTAKARTAPADGEGLPEGDAGPVATTGDRRRSRRANVPDPATVPPADAPAVAARESSTPGADGVVAARTTGAGVATRDGADPSVPAARVAGYQAEAKELLEAGAVSAAPPRRRRRAATEAPEPGATDQAVRAPRAAARRAVPPKPAATD